MRVHALKPFDQNQTVKHLSIDVGLIKRDGVLEAEFTVKGMDDNVFWPDTMTSAAPREGLWTSTCFEVFVGFNGMQYVEWNFSPSREWYAYAFKNYREGQPYILDAFRPSAFDVQVVKDRSVVAVTMQLDRALKSLGLSEGADTKLVIGLSAVIKANGDLSYWALKHVAEKPDFHRRESFIIGV